jgi:pSer/pThr/pTyr-binding forkhead associated (FHA) protein
MAPAICSRCQQPNRPTYRFCLSCGNPLGESGASQGPSNAPPQASAPARPAPDGLPFPPNGLPSPASSTLASMQAQPSPSDEARPLAAMPVIHLGPREEAPARPPGPTGSAPVRTPVPSSAASAQSKLPGAASPSKPPPPGASTRLSGAVTPTPPLPAAPAPAPLTPTLAPPRVSTPAPSPSVTPTPAPQRSFTPAPQQAFTPAPQQASTPAPQPAFTPAPQQAPPASLTRQSPALANATPLPAASVAPTSLANAPAPTPLPTPASAADASSLDPNVPSLSGVLPPLPGSDADAPLSDFISRCPRCQTGVGLGQLFCRSCGFALDLTPGAEATTKAVSSVFFAPSAPESAPAPGEDLLATVVNARRPELGDDDDDDTLQHPKRGENGAQAVPAEGLPAVDQTVIAAAPLDPGDLDDDAGVDSTVSDPAKPTSSAASADGPGPSGAEALLPQVHRRPTVNVAVTPPSPTDELAPTTPYGRLLVYTHNSTEGVPFALLASPFDIGGREGHIRLHDDPYVSPLHARLVLEGGRWYMLDLGSLNGVYRRLAPSAELNDGDLILLGQQVLRFEFVMDAERALRPAYQHGVALFGTPPAARLARLCQRTVEGVTRDVVHMGRDELTLGREGTDLSFPDDGFLSRRHAVLRRDASTNRFTLEDAGSSNGTFVALRGRTQVHDGDVFRIGLHLLHVEMPETPAGEAAKSNGGSGERGGSA